MTATNALTSINGTNGYQQHIDIDSDAPVILSVINASGEVTVSSSDQPGVWVIVRRSDGEWSDDEDVIPVTVDVNGNTISVHPDWAVAGGLGNLAKKIKEQLQNGFNASDWNFSNLRLNPDLNYDMRVQVPRALAENSKVSIKTASGPVVARDINAQLTAATASGRIAIANINGTTSAHTASGSIEIENVVGSLEANTASGSISVTGGEAWTALRTVSGSIKVDDSTLKNARVVSVSGSVKVSAVADNSQDYSFETVSGSVKLNTSLPATSQSKLSFRSLSGSGSADGDWAAKDKRHWTAGSGDTGPNFNIKTVSGSLKATARLDHGVASRHEALPAVLPPDVEAGAGEFGEPSDLEKGVEAATAWVKDFARGLSTPPSAPQPPTAVPPVPPVPPAPQVRPGMPPQAPDSGSDTSKQGSSWTWSTGSGAQAPSSQPTAPIDPAPAAETRETASSDTGPVSQPASGSETERLRVLEALERGEIDIDEALSRLDSGENPGS